MKRILIVGSGDVARRALPWLTRRFRVFALVRQPEAAVELRALGAVPVVGDLLDFVYRSNTKNVKALLAHIEKQHPGLKTVDGEVLR